MNRILVSLLAGLVCGALIVESPACKPGQAQTVIQLVTPAGACIAQALLSGGVADPLQIVAQCAGTTIDDVIAVIETLMAAAPDGGASAAHLADMHAKALAIKVGAKK
jgi:hypothetical protein